MATLSPFYAFLNLALLYTVLAETQVHIVHMDLNAMPTSFTDHRSWYCATLSSISDPPEMYSTTASKPATSSKLIYTYTHAINGFSAALTSLEVKRLRNSSGFISLARDEQVTLDTTHTPDFLKLGQISGAWRVSDYGTGVIVGLVDTGIWPESASFDDHGMGEIPSRWKGMCEGGTAFNSSMCNKKLIGAKFFNKGLIANAPHVVTENSTLDTHGHGTHTSSTAAGNYVKGASYFGYGSGTAAGIAPRSHLAMYKAFWGVNGFSSDIIAAIDEAIDDGVDILSLSFGSATHLLYGDPVAVATFAAVERGIVVAASAGNGGKLSGPISNGTPWLLTVAAGTIDRQFSGIATLGNGQLLLGASSYPGNSTNQLPLVFMNSCSNSVLINQVGYKVVVCVDNNNSVHTQVNNVNSAQVAGGIFISNSTDSRFIETSFPAIFLSPEEGQTLVSYINCSLHPNTVMEFGKTELGTKPAPMVASYSSRGPSISCPGVLKPDLMAPGTLVLAAWPRSTAAVIGRSISLFGDFNILSGTSMSCPHIAGVASLLKAARPEWSPAAIRSAMMTTADFLDNTGEPIKDLRDNYSVANPLAMGSGHVNPNRALDPGLVYDANTEDYMSLLCSMNYTENQIRAITRTSIYNCSRKSADLNYPSFIAFVNVSRISSEVSIVQKFVRTLTNVGDDICSYYVSMTPMEGVKLTVKPERLNFTKRNQQLTYAVTIEGDRLTKETMIHGALTWVHVAGKYQVRSPLVVTSVSK